VSEIELDIQAVSRSLYPFNRQLAWIQHLQENPSSPLDGYVTMQPLELRLDHVDRAVQDHYKMRWHMTETFIQAT